MIIATRRLQKLSSLSICYLHEDRIVNQVSFGRHSNIEERDKLELGTLLQHNTLRSGLFLPPVS